MQGNGHALMELQALLPHADSICLNKGGYGHAQASHEIAMMRNAKHYNISINCNATSGTPRYLIRSIKRLILCQFTLTKEKLRSSLRSGTFI